MNVYCYVGMILLFVMVIYPLISESLFLPRLTEGDCFRVESGFIAEDFEEKKRIFGILDGDFFVISAFNTPSHRTKCAALYSFKTGDVHLVRFRRGVIKPHSIKTYLMTETPARTRINDELM